MTVALLAQWGNQPPGTLFTSDAATEAAMVASKQATATLTGAVAYKPNTGSSPAYPPVARLKQVATRCFPPLTKQAGLTTLNSRSWHITRDVSVYPEFTFPNYYMNGATEVPNGPGLFDAYIEYPLGSTPVRALECSGVNGMAFVPGNNKVVFPVVLPEDAEFCVRTFQNNANGTIYTQVGGGYESAHSSAPEDFMDFSATNKASGQNGAIGAPNGTTYFPVAIKSVSSRRAVLFQGDSRGAGGDASISDRSCDIGAGASIVGKVYGYTNWCIAATLLSGWNAGTHTFFNELVTSGTWDVVVTDHGINDAGNGADGATIAARRATYAAAMKSLYPAIRIVGATMPPYVVSSDAFVSKANQTIAANQQRVFEANIKIRAGIPGEDACWDQADCIDVAREGKYPVSLNTADSAVTPVTLTGGISATTLTTTAVTGIILPGMNLYNAANLVRGSTRVVRQISGATGGVGTYEVNFNHSGFPYPATVAPGTALSSAATVTRDGLHWQIAGQELIVRNGGPALLSLLQ